MTKWMVAAILGASLLVAGCGRAPAAPPTDTNPPAPVPAGLYPPDVRTGIAGVDQVLTAIARKDRAAIDSLIKLSPVACTTQPSGVGELPCPDGKADGTSVDAFAYGACQINFFTTVEDARRYVASVLARPLFVYAVNQRTEPVPTGDEYEIILAESKEDNRSRRLFLDHQGKIMEVHAGCGEPSSMYPADKARSVLSPKG